MFKKLYRFFMDETYFDRSLATVLALIGSLLGSGLIDLGAVTESLGPYGWTLGKFLVPISIWFAARSGMPSALRRLTPEQIDHLCEYARVLEARSKEPHHHGK